MEPAPFSAGNLEILPLFSRWERASMEPAPFSAGNAPRRWFRVTASRCFNGAGAFQRRKLSDNVSFKFNKALLQWSRRLSAPETSGREGTSYKPVFASMEPAPFSAGNRTGLRSRATCGIRFNGAGAFQRRKPRCRVRRARSARSLQWSRRLSAPETRRTI